MQTAPIFISYSRRDLKYLRELKNQFAAIEANYSLDIFDDSRIQVGQSFKAEILGALDRAKVGVLLVSSDFLASPFVTEIELPKLLASARSRGLTVCVIHVRPSLIKHWDALANLQAMNDPKQPMSMLAKSRREALWVGIAERILGIARQPTSDAERGRAHVEYEAFAKKLRFYCLKALDLKSGFQFVGESALYSAHDLDELNNVVRAYNGIAEELLTRGKEEALSVSARLPDLLVGEFNELLPFALEEIHRAYAFQLNEVRVKINRFLGEVPPRERRALSAQIREQMQPHIRGIADKVPVLERKLDRVSEKVLKF